MTVEEMKAKGKADGRKVAEGAQAQQEDVSDYLALMYRHRAACQAMVETGLAGKVGDRNLALAIAYADGVLSCFD